MKVKILKPISSGMNHKNRNDLKETKFAHIKEEFYKPGDVIDFEKDIFWKQDTDIEKQLNTLIELGYVKKVIIPPTTINKKGK